MSCCGDNIPVNQEQYIRKDGKVTFIANQSMGGNRLTNVADAQNNGDAINLGQLNELIQNVLGIGNTYKTGVPIEQNTVVYMGTDGLIYPANSSDSNIINKVIGITTESKVENSDINVITYGTITSVNSLTLGATYYFDTNGQLTQSAPSTGFSQVVGIATTSTTLLFDLQLPVGI